jgi:hypothetical protein
MRKGDATLRGWVAGDELDAGEAANRVRAALGHPDLVVNLGESKDRAPLGSRSDQRISIRTSRVEALDSVLHRRAAAGDEEPLVEGQ